MPRSQSTDQPDLNLLRTLDSLLRERSVSRAAVELEMTPSGVSRALARLREYFEDDLFVREGRSMAPTPVALALEPRVARVLDELSRLRGVGAFKPSEDPWTVRVAGADYFQHSLLPALALRVANAAPGVSIHHVRSTRPMEDLLSGNVDLAINVWGGLSGPELVATRLVEDRLTCVLREGNPLVNEPLSVEAYANAGHVLVAPQGNPGGVLDDALAKVGRKRRVAIVTSTFAAALPIVAGTDLITALPLRIVAALASRWPVVVRPLPLEVEPFKLGMFWSTRMQTNPAHRWFRALLKDVVRESTAG